MQHNTTRYIKLHSLKCEWTVMDGVQALIFEAGRRLATYLANSAWTPSMHDAASMRPRPEHCLHKLTPVQSIQCVYLITVNSFHVWLLSVRNTRIGD